MLGWAYAWIGKLYLGSPRVRVTTSATELNQLAGAGAVKADLVKLHAVTATKDEINKLDDAGAVLASGTQAALISDPADGTTVDAESRTAINSIIDALQAFGIVASE